MLSEQLDQARVVSQHINRPRLDLGKHPLVKVVDVKGHVAMLASSLTEAATCTSIHPQHSPIAAPKARPGWLGRGLWGAEGGGLRGVSEANFDH